MYNHHSSALQHVICLNRAPGSKYADLSLFDKVEELPRPNKLNDREKNIHILPSVFYDFDLSLIICTKMR